MMPLLTLAALAGGAIVAREYWIKRSPHHAPTSRSLHAGKSYVLSLKLTGPTPPSNANATEVAESMGLHPFSVIVDAKDPTVFALTTGFTGKIGGNAEVKEAVLPAISTFKDAHGTEWAVAFLGNPVAYEAAAKTPAGTAAVTKPIASLPAGVPATIPPAGPALPTSVTNVMKDVKNAAGNFARWCKKVAS